MRRLHIIKAQLRAGFTLIELLAVIMIIGILAFFLVPKIPEAVDRANVTACKANMGEIYKGFMAYKSMFDRAPHESGVKFFAELISSGAWENSKSSAKRLTCPAVDKGYLSGIADKPETDWFKDMNQVNGDCSSYAGRDCKQFPLKAFPPSAKDALVADDNVGDGEKGNHRTTTVVLYGDGIAQGLELKELRDAGTITEDVKVLVVGPDSPREDLRKLSLD